MALDAERPSVDPVQRLFELSLDMLGTATVDGYFTLLNPAWERVLGWTRAELMAVPFISFVHPDDVDGSTTTAARMAGPGSPKVLAFENRYRTRDGDYRWLQWTVVAEAGFKHFVAKDVTERKAAEVERDRSDALHRTLTANLPDTTVFLLDHDLRILIADGEAITRLGWAPQDGFRGRLVTELYAEVPEAVLKLSVDSYRAALEGERRAFEFVSEGLTFAVQAVPVHGDDGSVASVLVVARDTTERTHAEEQLARRARQQNAVAELGRHALESHNLTDFVAEAVKTATATLGVDVVLVPDGAQLLPKNLSIPITGYDRPFGALAVRVPEPREFSDDEVAFLTAVATLIMLAVERYRVEQVTRDAALHDPLTGLANRTLALDRLALALARRQRERIDVAVFVLDLDGFKTINDSLGHAAGDEVLLALAPRLSEAVRTTDTVARLGGDEFVVICPDVAGPHGATEVAERIAAAVTRPLVLASGEHFCTVSVGGTLAASHQDTPESLLRDADAAMYRAKERGRGRYELFDEAMRISVMNRVRTEAELRRALVRGELEVWYQPVIDLATGRPVSTEALVRWAHPERGLIPPLEFIAIAEETGLIAALGLQVLEQACAQTAIWQREIDPNLGVSVNISGREAVNPLFPAQVAAIAEASGLRGGTLALEITETVLMEEADSLAAALATLQTHGLTFVLDDFGTGYSSLSRLKRFPLDVLKIDRSFVSGVDRNADDRAIVKATIDMAHAVGLVVVAEGVETREQEEHLRAVGCDRVQGYLYARPAPAEAVGRSLVAMQSSSSR